MRSVLKNYIFVLKFRQLFFERKTIHDNIKGEVLNDMNATLNSMEILDKADDLSMMILESDVVAQYQHCFNKVKEDDHAQKLIHRFVKLKDQYEDVQRFGKYHPDFDKVTKEIRQLKRKMDMHDSIAAFKKSEDELQKMLDEISVIIGKAVSEHIKVPTGNPYFDSISGCGCGTGGGCGCAS